MLTWMLSERQRIGTRIAGWAGFSDWGAGRQPISSRPAGAVCHSSYVPLLIRVEGNLVHARFPTPHPSCFVKLPAFIAVRSEPFTVPVVVLVLASDGDASNRLTTMQAGLPFSKGRPACLFPRSECVYGRALGAVLNNPALFESTQNSRHLRRILGILAISIIHRGCTGREAQPETKDHSGDTPFDLGKFRRLDRFQFQLRFSIYLSIHSPSLNSVPLLMGGREQRKGSTPGDRL